MKRPALATAVLISAALATAACSSGTSSNGSSTQAASGSAAASASSGAQSGSHSGSQGYPSMLDLYSAVLGTGTNCSDVSIRPATTAKAEASCDLGSGRSLLLQTWRDAASRDKGVHAVETSLSGTHAPYCVVAGTGTTGLWSVAGRGDSGVCATIAHKLGGTVTSSASAH